MIAPPRKIRCAICCRKSSEEGLSQAFYSLDAQREACLAYMESQRREGWIAIDDCFADGGFSGGSLDRPAQQRLLRDVQAGSIDAIVCYRIDRLSRSLADFTKLVEIFDRHSVSLVSITESFNTATSLGRLNLNMVLSFAQCRFQGDCSGERLG
jgi:site-specific DNA recombinase